MGSTPNRPRNWFRIPELGERISFRMAMTTTVEIKLSLIHILNFFMDSVDKAPPVGSIIETKEQLVCNFISSFSGPARAI